MNVKFLFCYALSLSAFGLSGLAAYKAVENVKSALDLENQYASECSPERGAIERYRIEAASAAALSNFSETEYATLYEGSIAQTHGSLGGRSFEILQLSQNGYLGSYESRRSDESRRIENLSNKCSGLRQTIYNHLSNTLIFSGYSLLLSGISYLSGSAAAGALLPRQ